MGLLCFFFGKSTRYRLDLRSGGYHLVVVINFDSWKLLTQILEMSQFFFWQFIFGMVTPSLKKKQFAPVKVQPGPKKEEFHHFNPLIFQVQTVRFREGKCVGCNPQPVPDIWPQKLRMLKAFLMNDSTFTAVSSVHPIPSPTPLGSLNFCNSCPSQVFRLSWIDTNPYIYIYHPWDWYNIYTCM